MPFSFSLRLGQGLTLQADALAWRDLPGVLLQGWRLRQGLRVVQGFDLAPMSRRIARLPDLLTAHERLRLAEARLPQDALLVASSDGTRSLIWRSRAGGPLVCLEASPR